MKDKERKLTRFPNPLLCWGSRILGIWILLCPFTYYAVKIYENKPQRNSIGVCCKFAGRGGALVVVCLRLRNAKSVSSQVIWDTWLIAGVTSFFLNLRCHCCKCNNVLSFSKRLTDRPSERFKIFIDDHNKDNDWIFNFNEICISNTNKKIQ